MATGARHTDRREDALSRERIVDAAVELLDVAGESGLTFRALSAQLKTGPGAIYWHVANKSELLDAATDAVLSAATTGDHAGSPAERIRAVALGLFDAIDQHPWLAPQLANNPWKSVTLQLFDRVGQQVQALGVPSPAQFTSASALMIYILGAAGQNAANAANARTQQPDGDRAALLETESAAWERLDRAGYPFLHDIAAQFREHDDRAQFLAGVDLILAGITALRPHG
ncbi:TetR/AcrR family transcriptional regulator [Actinoplanes regularis]|uniref:TetR/AcrR family transcriptional regulator n=1 Tax=Actinoplanes regularis TaxID=52697 RepID=UPI0025577D8D|nr:TetR/AcrR family transcriptional regulator C-terminal domain-containing protein [Actinoplanes regularis]GLW27786.1 TetR family transcriptional regulator [Actinoplanes regularis]